MAANAGPYSTEKNSMRTKLGKSEIFSKKDLFA